MPHAFLSEIHDVFRLIHVEVTFLSNHFESLYAYRIFIHYFCHNFIYFTFYAAKLQRKSESTKFSPSFLSSRIALQSYGIFSAHSELSRRFAKIRKKNLKKVATFV